MVQPVRLVAAKVVARVIHQGESLSTLLPQLSSQVVERDRPLLQALAFGVMRYLPRLQWLQQELLQKPLKPKERELQALLLIAFFQLLYQRVPSYAVVNESVAACKKLGKGWATGMVNGVLRNLIRQQESLLQRLESDPVARYAHPKWLQQRLQADWPEQWSQLLEAANQPAPMTLRVNLRCQSRETYLQQLADAGIEAQPHPLVVSAIELQSPQPVEALPGFSDGACSVQDAAAQLAAELLDPQPGERVLDACAAPGGKTGHLLERAEGLALLALDSDADRLARVTENLERLGESAELLVADAANPEEWWDGKLFHRILLDAPCSATGVIRRHPDIKALRRAEDIPQLVALQGQILRALWKLLEPGGVLLYATCSIFRAENDQQLSHFLAEKPDAEELPIEAQWGIAAAVGRQILTAQAGMDGFYYARLRKRLPE